MRPVSISLIRDRPAPLRIRLAVLDLSRFRSGQVVHAINTGRRHWKPMLAAANVRNRAGWMIAVTWGYAQSSLDALAPDMVCNTMLDIPALVVQLIGQSPALA